MEFPKQITHFLEEVAATLDRRVLTQKSSTISNRYRNESGTGKVLLSEKGEAFAYAATRMPATFAATACVLKEALGMVHLCPKTLLDVGAGTGTASWAAALLCDLDDITCLERAGAMSELGQKLMTHAPLSALQNAKWVSFDLTRDDLTQSADLVIASYVLNEMDELGRLKTAEKLWAAAKQALILVEPGTKTGYRQLMQLRDALLARGANLCAPCPHDKKCPLGADDWCHFAVRVNRSKIHKALKSADVPFEDEKFSYLILTRTPVIRTTARILRHPYIRKGYVSLTLCTPNGIETKTITKKQGNIYKAAKKSDWGDSFG
ncbi:MAG: small ribosomal subunit Rsm22 family protein [Lactobacillales bacterium]|jgi:ribosomal protein RSM22 (predicted rRNA methylase)|nr:small ribosomal subunit Rsm22 family protein [Lactobacillales bacterium]